MAAVDGGPEVSTTGATVVEDEIRGTVVPDVDREPQDPVDTDDCGDSVIALAAVCVTLATLQFGADKTPPAAVPSGVADF